MFRGLSWHLPAFATDLRLQGGLRTSRAFPTETIRRAPIVNFCWVFVGSTPAVSHRCFGWNIVLWARDHWHHLSCYLRMGFLNIRICGIMRQLPARARQWARRMCSTWNTVHDSFPQHYSFEEPRQKDPAGTCRSKLARAGDKRSHVAASKRIRGERNVPCGTYPGLSK